MTFAELEANHQDTAIRLWQACGLTVPWNDPVADFTRALDIPNSTILGFFEHSQLIGTVMVGYDGHRGWMYYLAVSPDHQGQGLGRALVEAAEQWLIERGAPKAMLMVRETNETVLGFYTALGYVDDKVRVLSKRFAR